MRCDRKTRSGARAKNGQHSWRLTRRDVCRERAAGGRAPRHRRACSVERAREGAAPRSRRPGDRQRESLAGVPRPISQCIAPREMLIYGATIPEKCPVRPEEPGGNDLTGSFLFRDLRLLLLLFYLHALRHPECLILMSPSFSESSNSPLNEPPS